LSASRNSHPEAIGRLKLNLGQGITGWVAKHRQPVVVSQDACGDPRFQFFNELPEDRFESFLSVPLLSRGRVVGVINLQNRAPHHYSHDEITLLSAIGVLVGGEVEMARLEKENSDLSHRLEVRKLVERAKGILQQELNIAEQEAYLMLQRQSQQLRLPADEQAKLTGDAWERLPEPKPRLTMEIIGADGRGHEYPLGPHEPRLRPSDVELLHKVWLEITADPRYAGLHHYDVVALALEELKRTLNSKDREALLQQFNSSATEIARRVR